MTQTISVSVLFLAVLFICVVTTIVISGILLHRVRDLNVQLGKFNYTVETLVKNTSRNANRPQSSIFPKVPVTQGEETLPLG